MPTNNKGLKELWGYPLIDEKARNAISDTRSSLENDFQKKTDDTLGTVDKTVPGAINEIKNNIDTIGDNFTSEQTETKYDMKYNGKSIGSIGIELKENQITGGDGSFNIDLSPYQTKTDTSLTTTNKTISGAIKELNTQYKDIVNNKADKTTTTNIQQQVNNLVLGAVGDGNNAEVVQARGEFSTLNGRLNDFDYNLNQISEITFSNNLFDISKASFGKSLNGTTDVVSNNTKSMLSEYCEINPNSYYLVTAYSATNSWGRTLKYSCCYAFYDKNKVYLSGANYLQPSITDGEKMMQSPDNACYLRFSAPFNEDVTLEYLTQMQLMLIETSPSTAAVDERQVYVPYSKKYKVGINNVTDEVKNILSDSSKVIDIYNLLKIKNNYRYLTLTFKSTKKDSLILLGSNDLKRFDLIEKQGIYTVSTPNSKCLRDPSIIQIEDYYYLVYTVCGFEQGDEIGFCRTKDFKNYEELENLKIVNPEDANSNFYYVWAPAGFRDIDGSLYLISACSIDSKKFYTYISKYDENTHTITSTHKTNIESIDGHIYYENGKYYMFVGGAFVWKSDTLLGEWAGIKGNNLYYAGYEADFAVRLEDGSWRLFMQELPQKLNSAHMVYVDAPSIEDTWSEPKRVEYTKKALDYIRSLNGNDETTEYYHWTIYDFNRTLGNNNYFKN